MVSQRSAARDRAAPPPLDELSRVSGHYRRPEGPDQALDLPLEHPHTVGPKRRSDREFLHQQRERRTAQEAVRQPETAVRTTGRVAGITEIRGQSHEACCEDGEDCTGVCLRCSVPPVKTVCSGSSVSYGILKRDLATEAANRRR